MEHLSKAEFLALSSKLYDELSVQLDSKSIDFYEYEKRLELSMLSFSNNILEKSLSDTSVVAHKKKKY